MKSGAKVILSVCAACGLLLAGVWGLFKWYYPYGDRTCCTPCTMATLTRYAYDHEGWFPKDGETPLMSLQKLYPNEWFNLAGISGNRDETVRRLKTGRALDETVSSWVYFPGFRSDDDSRLAIIWERQEGIAFNGSRAPGVHSVGFADGHHESIPRARWPEFLREQEALRNEILARRATGVMTNSSSKGPP